MNFDENLYVLKVSRTIYGDQESLATLLRQELISNLKRVQSINSRRIKEKQIEIWKKARGDEIYGLERI